MYCPNCASQNNDDAKFCRTCGANLSLVPQALTGQLPEGRSGKHRKGIAHGGSADLSRGITKAFTGFGFVLIAIVLCLVRQYWGVWMLIPGFGALGKGVAEIIAAREAQQAIAGSRHVSPHQAPNTGSLGADRPRELTAPPASVTESTTKLFDEADSSRH
jgi:hypothetical protein